MSLADMRIVFVGGAFDLLHIGHVRFLQAAKEEGDVLIVCVATDEVRSQRPGKGTPIIPFEQRFEMIATLECVDIVLPYEGPKDYTAVEKYGANVRVVSDQFEYPFHKGVRQELEKRGVEYVTVPHTPEVSTTLIKGRVKELYREDDSDTDDDPTSTANRMRPA